MRLSCLFCGNRCDNVGAIDYLKENFHFQEQEKGNGSGYGGL